MITEFQYVKHVLEHELERFIQENYYRYEKYSSLWEDFLTKTAHKYVNLHVSGSLEVLFKGTDPDWIIKATKKAIDTAISWGTFEEGEKLFKKLKERDTR
jgi:hypothetical protein